MKINASVKNNISQLPEAKNWIFAYSGGVDSCVLVDILSKLKPENTNLKLIHVNHGLGQKEATDWVKQAKETAEKIGAEFITTEFNMDEKESGAEEKARNLRHSFITKHVNDGDIVFMGHHKNDQAETLLFRLCRGTGIKGLSGISFLRKMGDGFLCRPLLDTTRFEIEEYALENHISWVEDDTNKDLSFSRNIMRHKVIPLLQERWKTVVEQLYNLSQQASENQELITEIAEMDLMNISIESEDTKLKISNDFLKELSPLRQKNVISYILSEIFNLNCEQKNFKNTLKVLLSENKNFSKMRKLEIKDVVITSNGKFIWFN